MSSKITKKSQLKLLWIRRNIGYTEGVFNYITSCSKYKKSHLFLLRIWEAVYIKHSYITRFLSGNTAGDSISTTQIRVMLKLSVQLPDTDASSLLML